jgi:AcrR family transcriptional regulator
MPSRAYARRRPAPAAPTRDRIMAAVRELLAEGTFHETTVETVAERAGVSRATLYQHFGSRLGLVDAMCDTFDANPALVAVRQTADVDEWIGHVVDFWTSEEPILVQLYGVGAADPAAGDLVARQRRDRYAELERLLERVGRAADRDLFARLANLTSFETFEELRRGVGLEPEQVKETLRAWARTSPS